MTREERIEQLQDHVSKGYITHDNELIKECGEDIEWLEDVLAPMGWNSCDRCGMLGDSELELFWLDGFDWDESNLTDKVILDNLAKEQTDYCAICYDCLNELKENK